MDVGGQQVEAGFETAGQGFLAPPGFDGQGRPVAVMPLQLIEAGLAGKGVEQGDWGHAGFASE